MRDVKKIVQAVLLVLGASGGAVGALYATFQWGERVGKSECASIIHEIRQEYERQIKNLEEGHTLMTAGLTEQIRKLEKCCSPPPPASGDIFVSGNFAKGLSVGMNTAGGETGWAIRQEDCFRLEYPGGHKWGTWFITVGTPSLDKKKRQSLDFSRYATLSLELKGKKGTAVVVALKDVDDDGTGNEPRHTVRLRSDEWEIHDLDLQNFRSADLRRLNVVTSFVFGAAPQTFSVRNIRFR